jgi:hypothetical protein
MYRCKVKVLKIAIHGFESSESSQQIHNIYRFVVLFFYFFSSEKENNIPAIISYQ